MSRDSGLGGAHRRTAVFLGLASLVSGAGPVYDSYVPIFLKDVLDKEAHVGFAMGLDNWAMLLLVPLFGTISDRVATPLGRRVPFVLVGLFAVAFAFSSLPFAKGVGAVALFAAIVGYSIASAAVRAPMAALFADLIPSAHLSRANGISNVMMCVGAMPLIALSRELYSRDPALPFLAVGALALTVAIVYSFFLREPRSHSLSSRRYDAVANVGVTRGFLDELRGKDRSLLVFLIGCVAFHMCFQSFSSWFTRSGAERYSVEPSDCSLGFIVVGLANLVCSIPAGAAGARFTRRRTVAFGLSGMAISSLALSAIPTLSSAFIALAVFGASWSLASVNLLPMALEQAGPRRAATFAAAFFVAMSVGGAIGPWICGEIFDAIGDLSALFFAMAAYVGVACLAMLALRPDFGEAANGPRDPADALAA